MAVACAGDGTDDQPSAHRTSADGVDALVTTSGRPSTIVRRADGSSAPATSPMNAVVGPTDPSASDTSHTIGFFAQPATQHVASVQATAVA